MNIEEIREYCLAKRGATECFPFDDTTLVFKVCGKMFAFVALDEMRMNLKCDPEKAMELREQFAAVEPGYHMNKRMWNTIALNAAVPARYICEWIDDSYRLVLQKISKKQRDVLLT
jgi:predicted DNA-binding protein (MmcQ/YjbR family)